MKKLWMGLVFASLLCGCNTPQTQAENNDPGNPSKQVQNHIAHQDSGSQANANQTHEDLSDAQAAQKAYSGNLAEIQLAELARQKAQSEEVRELAAKIEEDHKKANQQLKSLEIGLNTKLEDKLEPKHEDLKQRLSRLSGEEFDREYIHSQVAEHQKVLGFYEREAANTQDDELRNYFRDTKPVISHHLEQSREVDTEVGESTEHRSEGDSGDKAPDHSAVGNDSVDDTPHRSEAGIPPGEKVDHFTVPAAPESRSPSNF